MQVVGNSSSSKGILLCGLLSVAILETYPKQSAPKQTLFLSPCFSSLAWYTYPPCISPNLQVHEKSFRHLTKVRQTRSKAVPTQGSMVWGSQVSTKSMPPPSRTKQEFANSNMANLNFAIADCPRAMSHQIQNARNACKAKNQIISNACSGLPLTIKLDTQNDMLVMLVPRRV